MAKLKVKNPKGIRKAVLKWRLFKAKMKYHKTKTDSTIDLGNGKEVVLSGCETYTDLSSGQSQITNCDSAVVRQKNPNDTQQNLMDEVLREKDE